MKFDFLFVNINCNHFRLKRRKRNMLEFNEDKWISIEEAANYLGVNKDTIRNWIKKENGIPAHKIGKLWRFKKTELDNWIKSGQSAMK